MYKVENTLCLICISHTQKCSYRRRNSRNICLSMKHVHCVFLIKINAQSLPQGIRGLLIAQYEHKLDHSDIQEILPIGVIRCAAAKASPIENLPWVMFLPSGCLKKDNWCNVHAQCCELIKARGTGYQISQTPQQMSTGL